MDEVTTLYDDNGNQISFKESQGRRFHPEMPGDIDERLANISSLNLNGSDIILCSYPKSGSHWVYNLIQMLRDKSFEYYGSPFTFEFDDLTQIRELKSCRTFLTHLSYPFIPEEAKQGKIKLVSVLRNPKDVLCSMYTYQNQLGNRLFKGEFEGFFKYFLTDGIKRNGFNTVIYDNDRSVYSHKCKPVPTCGASWFTYVDEWETAKRTNPLLRCMDLRYEDLKLDFNTTIVKLAEFLGVGCDESFLKQLEKAVTIDNMRLQHQSEKGATSTFSTWVKDGRLPIYRKGLIGDWKHKFTVRQNDIFDTVYKEKMANISPGLDFIFE